jgi:signal transduction histidine kinase/ActR/RegA family two-component response regulator
VRSSRTAQVRLSRLERWWLDRSIRVKGMVVFAVPMLALIGVTSASLALQLKERQVRSVAITASTLNAAAQQALSDAVNAETGVRGYVATGNPLFLQPYSLTLARLARDRAALRAAAIAQGDSRAERASAATMSTEMAELDRLRAAVSAGTPATALTSALENGKITMDALRAQTVNLVRGPAATTAAGRAHIVQTESVIEAVSITGLALGVLAGALGVALFASGISRRIVRAAANADRLGAGEPLRPVPARDARDELGRLARSLMHTERLLADRTTELTTARDEAVRASQAKNTFLSSTSHELRTPLNAVLGFTQLLQLSDLSQEDREAVERILAAGQHLLALINELIDIARIESGEFSLSVEPVSVQPVVRESCQLMAPLAADRSITISPTLPWPALAVRADRQRLRQILVNLLSNAIKYNRAGGTVTITCQPAGPDRIDLTVADTGPGIPPDDLERIFDPFERLGAERTAIEGTGIGLPLGRAFAEAMHGHLTAASVPGEGATFTLSLPRAADILDATADGADGTDGTDRTDEADGTEVPVPRTAPDDLAGAVTRVLYIEDNPANIEVVTRFMKTRPGMRLRSVTSGQAGLEVAARETPDLILLDLHLPGLHGDEVLKRLRDKPATADIPVAILSAEAAPAIIRHMRASGVIAYLTKPLDLAALGQLLDSVAAGHDRQSGQPHRPAPAP